jgi:glutamate synthase domain-containing protein 1
LCGIAGVIYRTSERYQNLGLDLLNLIGPLESRGPDSCGVGLYGNAVKPQQVKVLLLSEGNVQWQGVKKGLEQLAEVVKFEHIGTGCRMTLQWKDSQGFSSEELRTKLANDFPQLHLMSMGQQLEIYKEIGAAANLFQKYNLKTFAGSHGIAHTRMATESVVDTYHSHPFTSALDMCIVHNGQISNYYKIRFALERQGVVFETHNDSEAIAHYLHYQLLQNKSLEAALNSLLKDFDGTYTFLVATSDKVGLVRDKFAAKPAVIYESTEMVAIASEYRCLINLPNFDPNATIREPDAGEINIWSVATTPTQNRELTVATNNR